MPRRRGHSPLYAYSLSLKWLTAKQLVSYHSVCAVEHAIVSSQPEYLRSTMGHRASHRHQHDTRRACSFSTSLLPNFKGASVDMKTDSIRRLRVGDSGSAIRAQLLRKRSYGHTARKIVVAILYNACVCILLYICICMYACYI